MGKQEWTGFQTREKDETGMGASNLADSVSVEEIRRTFSNEAFID